MTLQVESIAVGDELLDGRVADGNSKDLGDALSTLGLELARTTTVPDSRAVIVDALREASARADIIVTSGGLGPTTDDITAECIAQAAGVGLRFDEDAMARIVELFASRGFPMSDNNRRQALLPESSRTLLNSEGTAPGFVTPVGSARVWAFPGVPKEYRHLLHTYLLPALTASRVVVVKRTIRCLGIAESALGERLAELERANPDVRVQYRTSFPENLARLVISAATTEEATARADALQRQAVAAIGGSAYAAGDAPLERLVIDALVRAGQTVATAESCTGGLIAKRLSDVAGSSQALLGGVVAYADDVKHALLNVDRATLHEHGAVSEPVAKAMAAGAQQRLGAVWALSTTGIAGPGGGSPDKPVGTVWFGLAGPSGTKALLKQLPDYGRERVREMTAAVSLRWLLDELGASLSREGVVKFTVDQLFTGVDMPRFVDTYYSDAFNNAVASFSGLKERRLVSMVARDDGSVERRVRMSPDIPIPGPIKKLLGDRELTYDEVSIYDPRTQVGRYHIEHVAGDRVRASGVTRFVSEAAGVRRVLDGEVIVDVFGIGGVVERFIEGEVKKSYVKIGAFMQRYLDEHRP